MPYDIEIKEQPPQPVVAIRRQTVPEGIGDTLTEILPKIVRYLEDRGVALAGPPFTRYHTFSSTLVELEAGFPVAAPVTGDGEILTRELPGGAAAVTWHTGPYDTLSEAHAAVGKWLAKQGLDVAAAPYEVYWSNEEELDEGGPRWRTEIVWPVQLQTVAF